MYKKFCDKCNIEILKDYIEVTRNLRVYNTKTQKSREKHNRLMFCFSCAKLELKNMGEY